MFERVDRSFIDRIDANQSNVTLVPEIIAMCHQLGIVAVAEGIETESQIRMLRQLRCDADQGFLVSEPMSPSHMTKWLRKLKTQNSVKAACADVRQRISARVNVCADCPGVNSTIIISGGPHTNFEFDEFTLMSISHLIHRDLDFATKLTSAKVAFGYS